MKEFLSQYWFLIISVIVFILELILFILKKGSSKVSITDKGLFSDLMRLVEEAESKFKIGSDKLNYVVSKYKETHPLIIEELKESVEKSSLFSSSKDVDIVIISLVEYILSLPQKKERNK